LLELLSEPEGDEDEDELVVEGVLEPSLSLTDSVVWKNEVSDLDSEGSEGVEESVGVEGSEVAEVSDSGDVVEDVDDSEAVGVSEDVEVSEAGDVVEDVDDSEVEV